MQSMQRKFGKLMNRNPGDNAKISVLLNDYEDADRVLAKIIDSAKSWRDSWLGLLGSQQEVASVYASLYDPIVGASDGHGRESAPTPELQLNRTFKLREAYDELKEELVEEINSIEVRIIRPATDAREFIAPIRKTIKKRENKRLDFEKCQDKVHKLHRKMNRTPKEESSLSRAESELSTLSEEFEIADAHLRETLPPIIQATFSLLPPLINAHILVQNRLLGLYYTVLNGYCEENNFPSPPPPMEDVIAQWSMDFQPARKDMESIPILSRSKAGLMPMRLADDGASPLPSGRKLTVPAPQESLRRASTGLIPSRGNNGDEHRPMRIPSQTSLRAPSPQPPNYGGLLKPTDFTTASDLGKSSGGNVSPRAVRQSSASDYFASKRIPSPASSYSQASSNGAAAAAKKKPPPPPPPKRIPSGKPDEYVVAQYDFAGQGPGDLSFREGDRIKIVKKTSTDQDWWVGELGGSRGNFPANYCKPA